MWCVRHATLRRALARAGIGARPAGMPPILRDRAPVSPWRRFLYALVALLGAATIALPATADEIPVKSASLRVDDDEVLLSADFDLSLTPALEQALDKGIALYFTIDFELSRTRAFWFPEKVAQWSITYRVSYSALTRQYRVASGPLGQTFESLDDVERFIGRVASRPVAQASDVAKDAAYEAAVRMKLDINQLPKPFQLNALASREWQLASDWYRFGFTP
jgi:Domain of unknown function (DUF4390)